MKNGIGAKVCCVSVAIGKNAESNVRKQHSTTFNQSCDLGREPASTEMRKSKPSISKQSEMQELIVLPRRHTIRVEAVACFSF
jgi:hypothetical protein